MLLGELIRSCSHEKVAEAAVASIGPAFRRLTEEAARQHGQNVGAFVASRVRDFARGADEQDWQDLAAKVHGTDMPILTGLRHIVEIALGLEMPHPRMGGYDARHRTANLCYVWR